NVEASKSLLWFNLQSGFQSAWNPIGAAGILNSRPNCGLKPTSVILSPASTKVNCAPTPAYQPKPFTPRKGLAYCQSAPTATTLSSNITCAWPLLAPPIDCLY